MKDNQRTSSQIDLKKIAKKLYLGTIGAEGIGI